MTTNLPTAAQAAQPLTLLMTLCKRGHGPVPITSARVVFGNDKVVAVSKLYPDPKGGFTYGGVKLFKINDFARTRRFWSTQLEFGPESWVHSEEFMAALLVAACCQLDALVAFAALSLPSRCAVGRWS